jgi:hypothetical protein
MIGFETIGNATVVCFDGGPVLATDPWVVGEPYFGSWAHLYDIPPAQREAISQARYLWLSHGHPDHANGPSLDELAGRTILLSDHVGNRMREDLTALGFAVEVLPERTWRSLSPNVRVMSVSDYHQDAILLIDVGGTLLVDINDAVERGWGRFVRRVISGYRTSFLLKLFGYGDADMINISSEDGVRLLAPPPTESDTAREAWGRLLRAKIAFATKYYGTRYFIPFSMFHQYQRRDSVWAQDYTTPLEAFDVFESGACERLPAFIRYDCEKESLEAIDPPRRPASLREPEAFGDDWTTPLERAEVALVEDYFRRIEFLRGRVDFVNLRVGNQDSTIAMAPPRKSRPRGVTFEVPRSSLVTAVTHRIFDDLLIGNFMRTTLHGDWGPGNAPGVLYPYFTPYVARYADSAKLRTKEELKEYFAIYRRRAAFDYIVHRLEQAGTQWLRARVNPHSGLFRSATRVYSYLKRAS